MKAAWKGFLTEAESVAEFHTQISENLCNVEAQQIQQWQNKHFHMVLKKTMTLIGLALGQKIRIQGSKFGFLNLNSDSPSSIQITDGHL